MPMTTLEAKISMKMHLPVVCKRTYPHELEGIRHIKEIEESLDPINKRYEHAATIYTDGADYVIKIDDMCHSTDFYGYLKQAVDDYTSRVSVEKSSATIEVRGRASSQVPLSDVSIAPEYEKLLSEKVAFYKNEGLKKCLREMLADGKNKTQIIQDIRILIDEIKKEK